MMRYGWMAGLLAGLCVWLSPVAAQDAPAQEEALNLFFDCQGGGCHDMDFFRRQVPVVNWVRDREVSDLHVLITSQGTGGGGRLYTLAFIGRGGFEGQNQELTATTSGDATDDEQRNAIANQLKLGLVRYLTGTPAAEQIRVSMGPVTGEDAPGAMLPGMPPGGGPQAAVAGDDPWDFWVFTVRGNGFLNGESSFSSSNLSGSVSANRTTEDWKFNISARYSRNRSEFEVTETQSVVSLIKDWSTSGLLVKSLGPQWSLGSRVGAGRSTRLNEDLRWNVSPGIEYNFFPYSESSRRALTLQALLNVRHWDYTELTIYEQTSETRLAASLTASMNQIEPWGRVHVSLNGSQYLHDADLYQVSVFGSIEVRLFRGFSVNVSGNYAWIRDQLFPEAGGLERDEILLRQRAFQTDFSYFTSFGISYRFGSIFNNVVNPRFGGGGGGGMMFFF